MSNGRNWFQMLYSQDPLFQYNTGFGSDISPTSTPMGAPAFPAAPPSGGMGQPGVPAIFPEQAAPQMVAQGQPLEVGNPFMRFLHTQNPQDLALAAAIFSSSFTNPQQALQWAVQVRDTRQRQQQAMLMKQWQNDAIKERQKQGKQQSQYYTVYNKAANTPGMDMSRYPLDPTQWTPEVMTQVSADMNAVQERYKRANMVNKAIGTTLKTGEPPAEFADNPQIIAAQNEFVRKRAKEDADKLADEEAARRADERLEIAKSNLKERQKAGERADDAAKRVAEATRWRQETTKINSRLTTLRAQLGRRENERSGYELNDLYVLLAPVNPLHPIVQNTENKLEAVNQQIEELNAQIEALEKRRDEISPAEAAVNDDTISDDPLDSLIKELEQSGQ